MSSVPWYLDVFRQAADMIEDDFGNKGGEGMRIGHVHHEKCPICEYEMNYCQCVFSGDVHPNREIRAKIVKDHLELLSPKQIGHLVALEKAWNTSYGDQEYIEEFNRLKEFLKSDEEVKK